MKIVGTRPVITTNNVGAFIIGSVHECKEETTSEESNPFALTAQKEDDVKYAPELFIVEFKDDGTYDLHAIPPEDVIANTRIFDVEEDGPSIPDVDVKEFMRRHRMDKQYSSIVSKLIDDSFFAFKVKDPSKIIEMDLSIDEAEKHTESTKKDIEVFLETLKDHMRLGGGRLAENPLEKYYFKKHLIIVGEKGGGKTYEVSKMVAEKQKDEDIFSVDLRGHEGIESIDLVGHYVQTEDGGLIWKDGPLSQAFRAAKEGKRAILFIDEILRIPKRELNILVGCLTPDSEGYFSLDVGRAEAVKEDGIAVSEIIKIPQKMLWAVGTTNAGAGYAVDTIDEALADRFRLITKQLTQKQLAEIIGEKCASKGFDKDAFKSIMVFIGQFNELKEKGDLVKVLNLRHIIETIEIAETEDDIPQLFLDLIPTWTTQNQHGYPNETQKEFIEEMVKAVFDNTGAETEEEQEALEF